ncbi:MAG: AsnC family protein, partial [Candidatus Dormibacteria bacterium]
MAQGDRTRFEGGLDEGLLDESDSKILRCLQANARTTLADVGREVGLAASSV